MTYRATANGSMAPLLRHLTIITPSAFHEALVGLCVCCLATAGQLDVSWALGSALVSAVVHAPFLGMTAGDAIAAVLTGTANPSGRLTATWYTQGGGCRARACLWCWRC